MRDKQATVGDEQRASADEQPLIEERRTPELSSRATNSIVAFCAIVVAIAADGLAHAPVVTWLAASAAACALLAIGPRIHRKRRRSPVRIAVVGSRVSAVALEHALEESGLDGYEIAGWIAREPPQDGPVAPPRPIGVLGEVEAVVRDHDISLLVVGRDVPRLAVFDELLAIAAHEPVRALELSAFYEQVFGHIPVAEINSAWFQCTMHPKFRPAGSPAKRVFDLVIGSVLAILSVPLLLVCALLIKCDGGPVLYRQRRIGARGRPFTMYKLRTMRVASGTEPQQWCSPDDPRITRVGYVLRRCHLDELPQLFNVVRGEMSMVGPRPEQPDIVNQLEAGLAFYSRRHLIKPGLTGWAQIRCGYARSESASAWKLCHDLYYLKHQSLALDFAVLVRTLVALLSRRSTEHLAAKPLPAAAACAAAFMDARPTVVDQRTAVVASRPEG